MTKKTIIIFCLISFLIGAAALGTIISFTTRSNRGGEVIIANSGKLSDPTYKRAPSDAILCGPTINIYGAMQKGRFFTVMAENNCMSNTRTFEVTAICPVTYQPYSLQLQIFLLAGYNKEIQKFNALAGGTLVFLRNYHYGSIGAGITYAQGLFIKEYYAGASIIGKIDFSNI